MTTSIAPEPDAKHSSATPEHHPAFEWLGSRHIDSLNVTVEEYRHKQTGALHYHIAADNRENVFLVAFRTVPMDSTGVAHILEHTALCGSKRYPVRDPFFMMIRRSLNTFMNAFTSSDWTAYPFASQNRKDFYNLLDVYLDAAFFARLDEMDFLQEGHRVEFAEPDNADSPLEYKGVVFNEMKGAMSSTTSVLWQTVSKYLYPTSTYHYNSGGEPMDIPDLSYQQLKDFYRTHYHPGNAVFMTFGDIPVAELQQRFEDKALSHFERLDVHIAVEPEKRYLAPVRIEEYYACDLAEGETSEHKTHHVMAWLLGKCTSLHDMMRANLLSQVLLDNSASPLRKALETSELGSAPSPLCGLEDSNYEMCFLCGLEGSDPQHAEAFEQLVLDVLNDVAENGVPQEQLESVLHQLELHQREIGGDGYPYGLQLILNGLTAAIHRSDPAALLDLDAVIDDLRKQIRQPDFIKQLVRELLLDNPHRVLLSMKPDTGLSQRKEQAEKQRLQAIKQSLSDADKQAIIDTAKQLAERQLQHDDPEILPKVGLDDVPDEIRIPEARRCTLHQSKAWCYEQGTNGLVYHEVVMQLPQLDDGQFMLLPHYSSCLTEVGAGERDYLQMQNWQSQVSGGIHGSASIRSHTDDVQQTSGYFLLNGKALERNNGALAELMATTLEQVRFDEHDRIRDLIAQKRASRERSVTGSGHTLAMTAASAGLSPIARLNHRFSGLEGIRALKQLDDSLADDGRIDELAQQFAAIHQTLVQAPRQYMLVAEPGKTESCIGEMASVWRNSPGDQDYSELHLPETHETIKQMWVANTQVNFCAKAYATVTMEHPDAAALSVLGGFMRNGYLHTAIREQGGAYGGGAGHDPNLAAFRFFSYRDPRLEETLADFDKAIDWVLDGSHQWRQVEEAILGVISALDKPASPAGEARQAFHNMLHGRSPEKLRAFRQAVLAVTLDDLQRVAANYLQTDKASVALITNSATLQEKGDLGLDVVHL